MLLKGVSYVTPNSGWWNSNSPPQIQMNLFVPFKPWFNLCSFRWIEARCNLVISFIYTIQVINIKNPIRRGSLVNTNSCFLKILIFLEFLRISYFLTQFIPFTMILSRGILSQYIPEIMNSKNSWNSIGKIFEVNCSLEFYRIGKVF